MEIKYDKCLQTIYSLLYISGNQFDITRFYCTMSFLFWGTEEQP